MTATTPTKPASAQVAEVARIRDWLLQRNRDHLVARQENRTVMLREPSDCEMFLDAALLVSGLASLAAAPEPAASPPSPGEVRDKLADLIDEVAEVRGEHPSDHAVLQNADEIADAVLKLLASDATANSKNEPVVWRYRLFRETDKWTYETRKREVDCRRTANYEIEALYANSKPGGEDVQEACAFICETQSPNVPDREDHSAEYRDGYSDGIDAAATHFAAAIRARTIATPETESQS